MPTCYRVTCRGTSTPPSTTFRSPEASIPRTLRERRKQETRDLLERAALALFRKDGFTATSVDRIAAAAGVSRTTFFRYFPSKEAVVFAEQDRAAERFFTLLRERPAEENGLRAFEEALVVIARATEADPAERASALRQWALLGSSPTLMARYLEYSEKRLAEVAHALAAREGLDEPTTEHRVAAAVVAEIVRQVNLEWQQSNGELSAEAMLRERFRTLRALAAG